MATSYDHKQSRNLFIIGPVALYVCEAPAQEINDALDEAMRLARVSAKLLGEAHDAGQPIPAPQAADPELPPLGAVNNIELDCGPHGIQLIDTVQGTVRFHSLRADLATKPSMALAWNGRRVYAWRYASESDWSPL